MNGGPTHLPSYRRHFNLIPKSRVPRVLLHDNCSQQQLLKLTLNHLSDQEARARQRMELRRRTFLTDQALKQHRLSARGIQHVSLVPDALAKAHIKLAHFTERRHQRIQDETYLRHQFQECVTLQTERAHSPRATPRRMTSADIVHPIQSTMKSLTSSEYAYNRESAVLSSAKSRDTNVEGSIKVRGIDIKREKTLPMIKNSQPKSYFCLDSLKRKPTSLRPISPLVDNKQEKYDPFEHVTNNYMNGKITRNSTVPGETGIDSDKRFKALRDVLISPDSDIYLDGFLNLSEAGRCVVEQHRPALTAWQHDKKTAERRKSLHVKAKNMSLSEKKCLFVPNITDSSISLQFTSEISSGQSSQAED